MSYQRVYAYLDRTAGIQHGDRKGVIPDTFLVHTIEGSLEVAEKIFRGETGRVASTHYGVGSDGEIRLWVEEEDRAYGARGWNHRSIHMELEGFAKQLEYPDEQMLSAALVMAGALGANPSIPRWLTAGDHPGVKGHGDVDPDRRWDPGYIDVPLLVALILYATDGGIDLRTWHPKATLALDEFPESWLVHYVQHTVGANPDGQYGPITTGKVTSWQGENGLTADGMWGPVSWQTHYDLVAQHRLDALLERLEIPFNEPTFDPVPAPTPEPVPEPIPVPEPPAAFEMSDEDFEDLTERLALAISSTIAREARLQVEALLSGAQLVIKLPTVE